MLASRALAEIVHQRGKAYLEIRRKLFGLIEHHHHVHACIDLGMPLLGLGYAK